MMPERRIPLLKDHHTHPSLYAALSKSLDLRTVRKKRQALELIRASKTPVTVVFGWNNSLYTFEKEELERLQPVLICNVSLHSFLMNTAAQERFAEGYPEIVAHIEDPDWVETNLPEIFKFIVNIQPGSADLVKVFNEYLNRQGIWYAEEMLLPNAAVIDHYRRFGYLDRTRFWADLNLYAALDAESKKQVYGIKLFTDGALGPRTAALDEPYLEGGYGLLIYTIEELTAIIDTISDLGKPAAIHAIGDAATEQVITALEKVKSKRGKLPSKVRIEHCQFISAAAARRARSLGVVLSMQPNFNYDSVQYRDRLSKDYCARNNPFRMLIDDVGFEPGKDLIFGSDGMPHGIKYALEMALFPPVQDQRLTLDEFIAGYCMETQEHGFIDLQIDVAKHSVLSRVVIRNDGHLSE